MGVLHHAMDMIAMYRPGTHISHLASPPSTPLSTPHPGPTADDPGTLDRLQIALGFSVRLPSIVLAPPGAIKAGFTDCAHYVQTKSCHVDQDSARLVMELQRRVVLLLLGSLFHLKLLFISFCPGGLTITEIF